MNIEVYHVKEVHMQVVDLFCGVGGLTRGLLNSGLKVKAGFDFDKTCEFAYTTNNKIKFINQDIRETKADDIIKFYNEDDVRILVGCAPCQPFSRMRKKLGEEYNQNDDKYKLLLEFARLIKEVLPDIVSMENVPEMEKSLIFQNFLKVLEDNNYFVSYKVVYCPDYGIAQHRRRFVLLASRLGKIKLLAATHDRKSVNVKEFIGGLPRVDAGKICEQDVLHRTANLSEKNLKRIQASKPGGSWKDWPGELRAECHKKESGNSYTSVYARMAWDKIGPTITTQFYCYGTGRYGHPEQDRALTLREGALLQTFPQNYEFIDTSKDFCFKDVARHIGNAVPVRLGEIIGVSIIKHMEEINNDR